MDAGLPKLSPVVTFAAMAMILLARYFVVAGLAWWVAWRLKPAALAGRRIDPRDPDPSMVRAEIRWSIVSSLIFAAAATLMIEGWHAGWIRVYLDWSLYGWVYLVASLPLLLLLHETYFYWTHRWMHRPALFRLMHSVHHRSSSPTPWASFSFHWTEALVQSLVLPLLLLMLPVHWAILAVFLAIMTFNGVVNHLGYEVYPARWLGSGKLEGWITPTHHQLHHRNPAWHFGLYFTFWDRWMGTQTGTQKAPAPETIEAGSFDADVLIAGAGLSGGAIAWWLAEKRPALKVLLVDRERKAGGNHTWSFHSSDLTAAALRSIEPWISRRWDGHEVRFPGFERKLQGGYASIRSERFHEALSSRLGNSLLLGTGIARLGSRDAVLDDGRTLRAKAVLDCRGFAPELRQAPLGFQKFLGLDLRLESPHGLERPMLMDATVEQRDGFRFFYLLPWDERRLLVEDTRYSDGPAVDEASFEAEIRAYCERRGWKIDAVERREQAALPIPLARVALRPSEAARAGLRACLFHATTGYSLPDAIRVAERLAALRELTTESATAAIAEYRGGRESAEGFYLALNRMLFEAAAPERRYRVLARFYGLSEGLIRRFYSGESGWLDRARILAGRPPVPVLRAARAAFR